MQIGVASAYISTLVFQLRRETEEKRSKDDRWSCMTSPPLHGLYGQSLIHPFTIRWSFHSAVEVEQAFVKWRQLLYFLFISFNFYHYHLLRPLTYRRPHTMKWAGFRNKRSTASAPSASGTGSHPAASANEGLQSEYVTSFSIAAQISVLTEQCHDW
jgi:hypothetical protein